MVDTSATPARARPAVVTISSWLLILYAAIQVVSLILTLSVIGTIRDVMRDAFQGTSAEQTGNIAVVAAVGGAAFAVLLAAAMVVLALFNNRGKNGSRIATWIVGGILICCSGIGLVNNAAGGFIRGGPQTGNMPSAQEIQRRLEDALPWYRPVTTLLGVLALLALLVALILLALPKSNEFFRKPQPAWGGPGAGYPPYPGYPHAGQPQAPGYPSYPGAPGHPQPPGQPGWPQGPGQPGEPSSSGQWQQPPPPAPPSSAPPAQERTEGEPGGASGPGTEREGGTDRPGPYPPSGS
ncbi:hypothetical protein [Micromonospora globispora]|uniref:hypothetical protein n=1 Tax=Micromonospora globispora TaxID=1450148 RepID=UPI001FAFB542|nr:hypothetical protein [Micromonospora globispora]